MFKSTNKQANKQSWHLFLYLFLLLNTNINKYVSSMLVKKKGKAIPVTGCEGP
jgi:hypothetical protein